MPALPHTFAPLTGPIPLQYLDDNFTSINNITRTVSGSPVTRFLLDKLNDFINVKDFGAACDGVTDDTNAIQQCLNSFSSAGGTAYIPNGGKCVINSSLTIPTSCHLVGPLAFVGSPGNNSAAPYGNVGGALLVNSATTISINSGASIRGLLIYRKGMTFPAADSSLFAGTALTVNGDDASAFNCQILGFNKAFLSNGFQRPRCEYLLLDNVNGIEITACADIPYVSNCHSWPFSTIASGAAALKDTRQGTAYSLHDLVDWGKLTNCFSWGYLRGFVINNANSCTLLSCGTDNLFSGTPQLANSIGVELLGSSQDTRIIGHQSAAQATAGIHINTNSGLHTEVLNPNVWGGSTHGVLIDGGDASVRGGCIRGVTNAITWNNNASRVTIDGVRTQQITGVPFLANVTGSILFIGAQNDYGDLASGTAVVSGNAGAPTIASAATVNIPTTGNDFIISGVAGISALAAGWIGRQVTLYFQGVLTITSATATTNSIRLSGAANYTTSNGGSLTVRHNGVQWYEIGRSA